MVVEVTSVRSRVYALLSVAVYHARTTLVLSEAELRGVWSGNDRRA